MAGRKTQYPAWPGTDAGSVIAQRGELRGGRWLGYGRQSMTQDGEEPSTEDQSEQFWDSLSDDPDGSERSAWLADPDAPAGQGAKERPNFEVTMAQVRANQSLPESERAVGIWVVHSSRQTRGDVNIYEYADEIARAGMVININGRIIINPRYEGDLGILARKYIEDREKHAEMSETTARNLKTALKKGKPPMRPAYGLRRDYKGVAGKTKIYRDVANWDGSVLGPQWPDWDAAAGGGRSTAPARIVQLIFWWLDHGREIGEIVRWLNEREIKPPGRARSWIRQRVISIAGNPLYKGCRDYLPKDSSRAARQAAIATLRPGAQLGYDILVETEQYDAVQDRLDRHPRTRRITGDEPGGEAPGYHQSTGAVRCGDCGEKLTASRAKTRGGVFKLRCPAGHVSALETEVDDRISARMILWSCRQDVQDSLREVAESGSGAAMEARERARSLRAEADKLQAQRKIAKNARVIISLTESEAQLRDDADLAEAAGWEASLSTELARFMAAGEKGAIAATGHWKTLPVTARKALIAEVAEFRLSRSEPGRKCFYANGKRAFDIRRLRQTWKLGPDPDLEVRDDGGPDAPPSQAETVREVITAHLAASPGSAVADVADTAGMSRPSVYWVAKRMRAAGEIIPDKPGRGGKGGPVRYSLRDSAGSAVSIVSYTVEDLRS